MRNVICRLFDIERLPFQPKWRSAFAANDGILTGWLRAIRVDVAGVRLLRQRRAQIAPIRCVLPHAPGAKQQSLLEVSSNELK